MMRIARVIAVVAALPLLGAATPHIHGAGSSTCAQWTAHRADKSIESLFKVAATRQWVLGFVTASKGYLKWPDSAPVDSDEAVVAWLDSYCRRNPDEIMAKAASDLVVDMARHLRPH